MKPSRFTTLFAVTSAFALGVLAGLQRPHERLAQWWESPQAFSFRNAPAPTPPLEKEPTPDELLREVGAQFRTLLRQRDDVRQAVQETEVAEKLLLAEGHSEESPAYREQWGKKARLDEERARLEAELAEAERLRVRLCEAHATPQRVGLDPEVRVKVRAYLLRRELPE